MPSRNMLISNVDGYDNVDDNIGGDWLVLLTELYDFKKTVD